LAGAVQTLSRQEDRSFGWQVELDHAFKGAAVTAALGPWKSQFDAMVEKGMRAPVALVTLARKIAAISLVLWKKGERYNKSKVKFGHAA